MAEGLRGYVHHELEHVCNSIYAFQDWHSALAPTLT
jgi:hypothetical protein